MRTIDLAKKLMNVIERRPRFSKRDVGELNEIFNHKVFLEADDTSRRSLMLSSS